MIIISATFQLAADFKDMGREHELGVIALDFKSAVGDSGSGTFDSGIMRTYSFGMERFSSGTGFYNVSAAISGEYVEMTATASDGRLIHAVKPLTLRVLPFNESTLRSELAGKFGHDGTIQNPIITDYMTVTGFLSQKGANKVLLNTGMDVFIQKTITYVEIDSGVYKLDYVLVYQ
ncbi:MAG TPA: hypothetical protein C5S50_03340 [Methanosarcinaceae archaeon]|nr:hypothetical protein [Methanosarcinaceae archaeon]